MCLAVCHLISLQACFGRRQHHLSRYISLPIHHINQVGLAGKPLGGQGGSIQPSSFEQLLVDGARGEALSLLTLSKGCSLPQGSVHSDLLVPLSSRRLEDTPCCPSAGCLRRASCTGSSRRRATSGASG